MLAAMRVGALGRELELRDDRLQGLLRLEPAAGERVEVEPALGVGDLELEGRRPRSRRLPGATAPRVRRGGRSRAPRSMSRRSATIADCSPARTSASAWPASLKRWLRAIERSARLEHHVDDAGGEAEQHQHVDQHDAAVRRAASSRRLGGQDGDAPQVAREPGAGERDVERDRRRVGGGCGGLGRPVVDPAGLGDVEPPGGARRRRSAAPGGPAPAEAAGDAARQGRALEAVAHRASAPCPAVRRNATAPSAKPEAAARRLHEVLRHQVHAPAAPRPGARSRPSVRAWTRITWSSTAKPAAPIRAKSTQRHQHLDQRDAGLGVARGCAPVAAHVPATSPIATICPPSTVSTARSRWQRPSSRKRNPPEAPAKPARTGSARRGSSAPALAEDRRPSAPRRGRAPSTTPAASPKRASKVSRNGTNRSGGGAANQDALEAGNAGDVQHAPLHPAHQPRPAAGERAGEGGQVAAAVGQEHRVGQRAAAGGSAGSRRGPAPPLSRVSTAVSVSPPAAASCRAAAAVASPSGPGAATTRDAPHALGAGVAEGRRDRLRRGDAHDEGALPGQPVVVGEGHDRHVARHLQHRRGLVGAQRAEQHARAAGQRAARRRSARRRRCPRCRRPAAGRRPPAPPGSPRGPCSGRARRPRRSAAAAARRRRRRPRHEPRPAGRSRRGAERTPAARPRHRSRRVIAGAVAHASLHAVPRRVRQWRNLGRGA